MEAVEMTGSEELFMVCDDTNNIDFDDIDFSKVPPEVLSKVESILTGKEAELAAA